MKTIRINENSYKKLFIEDVQFSKGEDGNVNVEIGKRDNIDKYNSGSKNVDTRIFGTRNDILFGDGTSSSKNLNDSVLSLRATISTWKNVIAFINNGHKGPIFTDNNISKTSKTAIEKFLSSGANDEEIVAKAYNEIKRITQNNAQNDALFNRVNNESPSNNKVARYTKYQIPSTNVMCIALFHMGSFDLSDAIKKGGLRKTSPLFNSPMVNGILGDVNDYNINSKNRVGVTYDGWKTPDISQNFSLNDIDNLNKLGKKDHIKNMGQYQDANNYTSVNQFLDKSIMYAAYALKKEDFQPDFIISAPSSSKMNDYYSTNLSNKLGCTFIRDFFKRNIINAHIKNNMTDEDLYEQGYSTYDVEQIKNSIKSYCYNEITYMIEQPIRDFIKKHMDVFSTISITKNSREKASEDLILNIISKFSFNTIRLYIPSNEYIGKTLLYNFLQQKDYTEKKNILASVQFLISTRLKKEFRVVIEEMLKLFHFYSENIKKGYSPMSYGVEQSKITRVDKKYRDLIEGSYIIADTNYSKNGELFERVKNSKFLIVDEDVNSGGTFKLTIEALQEKLNKKMSNNILCLANGFSNSGR